MFNESLRDTLNRYCGAAHYRFLAASIEPRGITFKCTPPLSRWCFKYVHVRLRGQKRSSFEILDFDNIVMVEEFYSFISRRSPAVAGRVWLHHRPGNDKHENINGPTVP